MRPKSKTDVATLESIMVEHDPMMSITVTVVDRFVKDLHTVLNCCYINSKGQTIEMNVFCYRDELIPVANTMELGSSFYVSGYLQLPDVVAVSRGIPYRLYAVSMMLWEKPKPKKKAAAEKVVVDNGFEDTRRNSKVVTLFASERDVIEVTDDDIIEEDPYSSPFDSSSPF